MADWLKKTDPSYTPTLEEIRQDSHAYLVPDYGEVDDLEAAIENYLKANFQGIFLNELTAWYTDPATFPKMNYPVFCEWFEVTIHTMVFDTVNTPLRKE